MGKLEYKALLESEVRPQKAKQKNEKDKIEEFNKGQLTIG
jgi:hypothetical protein